LAKFTRQHVTVALTGDGGDEAFAGYGALRAGSRNQRGIAMCRRVCAKRGSPSLLDGFPRVPTSPANATSVQGIKRLGIASAASIERKCYDVDIIF
jgi:hypothetical protein